MAVEIIAHRGSSLRAPENTMAAFALAIDEGADAIELDVRESRDGVVVVLHDPDLMRVAGRTEAAAALDASELTKLDVGRGEHIPTLDAVIDLVAARGLTLHVEIKGNTPSRRRTAACVTELFARRSARERDGIVVSSFYPQILATIRHRTRMKVAFLFDRKHTGLVRARVLEGVLRPDGIHPEGYAVTPERIARWRKSQYFVNAWTIDRPEDVRTLAAMGVDGIITNDPLSTRAALTNA